MLWIKVRKLKIIDILSWLEKSGKISTTDISDAEEEIISEVLDLKGVKLPKIQFREDKGLFYVNVPREYSYNGKRHQLFAKTEKEVLLKFKKEAYQVIDFEKEKAIRKNVISF